MTQAQYLPVNFRNKRMFQTVNRYIMWLDFTGIRLLQVCTVLHHLSDLIVIFSSLHMLFWRGPMLSWPEAVYAYECCAVNGRRGAGIFIIDDVWVRSKYIGVWVERCFGIVIVSLIGLVLCSVTIMFNEMIDWDTSSLRPTRHSISSVLVAFKINWIC